MCFCMYCTYIYTYILSLVLVTKDGVWISYNKALEEKRINADK
jgi:hypothetical protein